jgi:hypothetical protein
VHEPARAGFEHLAKPSGLSNESGRVRDDETIVEQAAGRARPTELDAEGARDDDRVVFAHALTCLWVG